MQISNNFYNKPRLAIVLLAPLITITYLSNIIFLNFMNLHNHFIKNYLTLASKHISVKNANKNINTVTYMAEKKIISRQINNDGLQSYINDKKGSIIKLKNGNSNSENYSYDSYGNIIDLLSKSKSFSVTIENPFKYNSERFDANTKLQYLRARFYYQEIKRFISIDYYDLLNKFLYVNANPINYSDPTGHMREETNIAFKKLYPNLHKLEVSNKTKHLKNLDLFFSDKMKLKALPYNEELKNALQEELMLIVNQAQRKVLNKMQQEGLDHDLYMRYENNWNSFQNLYIKHYLNMRNEGLQRFSMLYDDFYEVTREMHKQYLQEREREIRAPNHFFDQEDGYFCRFPEDASSQLQSVSSSLSELMASHNSNDNEQINGEGANNPQPIPFEPQPAPNEAQANQNQEENQLFQVWNEEADCCILM